MTVLSGIGSVIVIYLPAKPETAQLSETFTTLLKLGFGAIVGLLGGKALK